VRAHKLLDISGRRRLPQFELAKKLGVYNYPCPSSGCLLTFPELAARLRDYLENEGSLTIEAILLLKVGRHFRVSTTRIVVSRNRLENNILEGFAGRGGTRLEVEDVSGLVTLVLRCDEDAVNMAAKLTVRYSDAQMGESVWVKVTSIDSENRIKAEAREDDALEFLRIKAYSN
jgi:hypothetical protein